MEDNKLEKLKRRNVSMNYLRNKSKNVGDPLK
jgi:hypothetical protein